MSTTNTTEAAWNATKAEGDAPFNAVPLEFRTELEARAADVISSGVTTSAFDEKVKELHGKQKSEAPETPLGTKNAIGEAPVEAPKGKSAEAKSGQAEKADAKADAKAAEDKKQADHDKHVKAEKEADKAKK